MPLTRSLTRPLTGALCRALTDPGSSFSPLTLFAGGKDGGWYDPSDLSTLWQDSARTTPVTASGQPVGAIDDKSGNSRHLLQATAAARPTYLAGDTVATVGTELVSNGDFATDTVWTKGAGWTIAGGVGVGTGTTANLDMAVSVTAGKLYRITYTISGFSAGTVRPAFTGGTTTNGYTHGANGTFTEYMRAEAGNTTLSFDGVTAFTGNIDNVSLVECLTFTGYPCLRFDGSDDCMFEANTHTMSLPVYAVWAASKPVQESVSSFGSRKDSTNYVLFSNVNLNDRVNTVLRSTALGQAAITSGNSQTPVATRFVVDSLHVAGTSAIKVDNNTEATVSNTWVAQTLTLSKIQLAGTAGLQATIHDLFGGLYLLADPGAGGRANCKTHFGRKTGQAL